MLFNYRGVKIKSPWKNSGSSSKKFEGN